MRASGAEFGNAQADTRAARAHPAPRHHFACKPCPWVAGCTCAACTRHSAATAQAERLLIARVTCEHKNKNNRKSNRRRPGIPPLRSCGSRPFLACRVSNKIHPKSHRICRRARRSKDLGAAQPVQAGLNRPEAGLARCRGCVARLELGLGGSGEQALRDLWSGLTALRLPRARNRRSPVCAVGHWPGEGIGGWEARPRQNTPVRGARRSARGRWAAVLAAQAPDTVWAQAALLEQSRGECHLPLQRS